MKRPNLGDISTNIPEETATSSLHYMNNLDSDGPRSSIESHKKGHSDSENSSNNTSSSDIEFPDGARKSMGWSVAPIPTNPKIPALDSIFVTLESLLTELHSTKKDYPSPLCSLPCTFVTPIRLA